MQQQQAQVSVNVSPPTDDDRYADFLSGAQAHFGAVAARSPQLFTTDAEGLWEAYLDNAPPGVRQGRTCNCCRSFIQKFGGLVSIDASGAVRSAVWTDDAPPAYADATRVLRAIVERANVTGVFRAKETTWGTPRTGPWTHISLVPPRSMLSTSVLTTPGQEMAAKLEEFRMLQRSLSEFTIETVRQARALLTGEALYRSEKCEGVARWLLELHEALAATKNRRARTNIVWLAVAKAPAGYCHVRSSMIGTLLEDIAAGLPFETVKRKFAEKMNPLQYMRPTAAPSAGNVAQAEKIVEALRSAGALERRFARLSDIQTIWTPRAPIITPAGGGVFGHLLARDSSKEPQTSNAPPTLMTWAKFSSTVLPSAESIEFLVPGGRQSYTATVTAKNPDAPNLLQWDNPVSHYVYSSGSLPGQWNLIPGRYQRVTAVSLRPWMWGAGKFDHHGAGVVFMLEGARDVTYVRSGGMFPEQMKSEYHAVRRTLEAHFRTAVIEGAKDAEACGIALVKGAETWNLVFRVTARGIRTTYKLDRWD